MCSCTNLKVLPITILEYHECCICYEKKRKSNLIKCENELCVDGYVCTKCRDASNNILNKCPLCRCDSKKFIIEIKETPYPILEIENNKNENICSKILLFLKDTQLIKMCIFLLLFILSCICVGGFVFVIFGGNVEETNLGTLFVIGIVTILVSYLICGFFCCNDKSR